jgi:hypothetical protein
MPPDLRQAHVQRILARVTLTPDEQQEFRRENRDEQKAARWLMDRIAAKDAVRTLWRERQGERLFPADIQISAASAELFRAHRRAASNAEFPPVAVAAAGAVTAALSAAEPSIGLAIAQLDAAEEAPPLQPDESALLDEWGPDRREAATRFRCARQAVAAALGLQPAASLRVCAGDPATGTVSVACGDQTYRVQTARDGAIIVAVSLGRRDD